jgi:hypothetical protein
MQVMAILTLKIDSLIKFFNVGKNMNATQIADTIMLILENYPRLRPEDIELCFKKAKSGQYGQLYDRLDGQVILGWIYKYNESKETFVEHNNFTLHLTAKKEEPPSTPEMRAAGIALLKKTHVEPLKKAEMDQKKKKSIAFTRNVISNMSKDQEWLNNFDYIHKTCGKRLNNGVRYIERYKLNLTITDFIIYKQDQYIRVKKALQERNTNF